MVQDGTRDPIMSQIRKVVGKRSRETVAHISTAVSPLIAKRIIHGPVVQAMRPGVGGQGRQSPAQPTLELRLHSMIVGRLTILNDHKRTRAIGRIQ